MVQLRPIAVGQFISGTFYIYHYGHWRKGVSITVAEAALKGSHYSQGARHHFKNNSGIRPGNRGLQSVHSKETLCRPFFVIHQHFEKENLYER